MVHVFDTADAAARSAARWIATRARQALDQRGRFDLALPGGRSPLGLMRALATDPALRTADWARIHAWLADERAVPPDDAERNDLRVRQGLVRPGGLPADNLHPVPVGTSDLEAAARAYEVALPDPLDLVVLGLGEDGHVASLFPGSPLLADRTRRVGVVLDSPKPPPGRVTLMPLALLEARDVVVLALGSGRAAAAARALEGAGPPDQAPARLVREREWWLDQPAALLLRTRVA